MTALLSPPTSSRYEASSSTLVRDVLPHWSLIAIGGALAVPGTSAHESFASPAAPSAFVSSATTSRHHHALQAVSPVERTNVETAAAVAELRRRSGLTWDQLAQLFGVSRRSVHFWASGKALSADNERDLFHVLDIVRSADRGEVRATRAAILEVEAGTSAFGLLTVRRFADAASRLGAGAVPPRPGLGLLSPAAKAARTPLPPAELVATADDRVHREPGPTRAARTVRQPRRGSA